MVEPEVAFAELDEIMELAEDLVCCMVQAVLGRHEDDLRFLGRDLAPLKKVAKPFARITYGEARENLRSEKTRQWLDDELTRDRGRLDDALRELSALEAQVAAAKSPWQKESLQGKLLELREAANELEQDIGHRPDHIRQAQAFEWGKDLGGSDETILSRQFDKPVFVTHYPRDIKAFYMKADADDPCVVRNMDLLAPEGYGEIIGGSQREDDLAVLTARLREKRLDPAVYEWYLDLRRFGTVPHGGFGLGVERALSWICGLKHVREAIPFPRTLGRIHP